MAPSPLRNTPVAWLTGIHLSLRKGQAKMAAAFLVEPQFGVGLVRGQGLSPSTVFHTLRKWEEAGLIVRCDAPPNYAPFVRSDAEWYVPTPEGRRVLVEAIDHRKRRIGHLAPSEVRRDGLTPT